MSEGHISTPATHPTTLDKGILLTDYAPTDPNGIMFGDVFRQSHKGVIISDYIDVDRGAQ